MPVPSLDSMKAEDLEAFARDATEHARHTGSRLFPSHPRGYVGVCMKLGVYANLLLLHRMAVEAGEEGLAARQRAKMADIRARLPGWARW